MSEAAASVQTQAVRAVALALGHLLRQQSWARDKLRMHAGGVVQIGLQATAPEGLPPPDIRLLITPEGLLEPAPAQAAVRASLLLKPSADALFALGREGVDGLSRHLRVEGDVMLAASLGELARHLRWDAEEDLSRLIGDVAARRAVGLMQTGLQRLRGLAKRPAASLEDFLATGQGPVATKAALRELDEAMSTLDGRLSRLDLRLGRLEARR